MAVNAEGGERYDGQGAVSSTFASESSLIVSTQVTSVYHSGHYQLRQLRPLKTDEDCVHQQSVGLLQRTVLRPFGGTNEPPTVSSERGCSSRHRLRTTRTHNACSVAATMASGSSTGVV